MTTSNEVVVAVTRQDLHAGMHVIVLNPFGKPIEAIVESVDGMHAHATVPGTFTTIELAWRAGANGTMGWQNTGGSGVTGLGVAEKVMRILGIAIPTDWPENADWYRERPGDALLRDQVAELIEMYKRSP